MKKSALTVIIFVLLIQLGYTQDSLKVKNLSEDKHLEWWSNARFGMFIHWGVYAQDGCFWNGKDGRSEHMMRILEIPISEYEKIALKFNPLKFNADEWVKIAKDAGMKYMVITAKHHDGFAMFDSPSDDYNIIKRTPWKHDPLKELTLACAKQGLRFGVYYSLGRDWHDPDCNSTGGNRSNTWDFPDEGKKDFAKYFEHKVKPQITELMTQYNPAILWFDTPELITLEQSEELLQLIRGINPECIVNQRIGNKLGDYAVREQKIPVGGEPRPWETCMTLNNAWGYYKIGDNWKSADSLIHSLIDIASKGGNFLLNVGPTGEGILLPQATERLKAVGQWMKLNSESIYGTQRSPYIQPEWGRITMKAQDGKATLYLNVFDWPGDGKIALQLKNKVESCYLLTNSKRRFKTQTGENGITVNLTGVAPDSISSVVVLKLSDMPEAITRKPIGQNEAGIIDLVLDRAQFKIWNFCFPESR